jgi:hypothetical protein
MHSRRGMDFPASSIPLAEASIARTLTDKSDTESLDFASACESYKRPIIIKTADGTVKEDHCMAIASVVSELLSNRRACSHLAD